MVFASIAWDWCKSNSLQVDLEEQEWEAELHSISHPAPGPGKYSQAVLIFLLQDSYASHDMASPY